MSKDQKKTIEIPVNIVENWKRAMEYKLSCFKFWNCRNQWPIDLIYDKLGYLDDEINIAIGETMSKDQKKTINIPVDIVENWKRTMEYMQSCIKFWNCRNQWPINLIYDSLEYLYDEINIFISEDNKI